MNPNPLRQQVANYPELRAYIEGSNESEVKREKLRKILEEKLWNLPFDYEFHILDVGCSDGEMFLPLVVHLKKGLPKLKYTALEPEVQAFEKFIKRIKGMGLSFIQPFNKSFEAYLQIIKGQGELFDFILFSQSFYFFPKSQWDEIIYHTLQLLKPNGFVVIVLDSYKGEAYKLCNLISSGKAETMEFGGLYSAEDMEEFLMNKGVNFKTDHFTVSIFIKDNEDKLDNFARILAFLYRTFPEKILSEHRGAVEKFLEECNRNGLYVLENQVRIFSFTK